MVETTGLAWVQEPTISEGKVVYKYKNSSDADAAMVGESVWGRDAGGNPVSQSFQIEGLAAGAEQETHVPFPSDLVDGPITFNLQIQSSDGANWVGELLFELNGQIAGGALHPAGEAAPATPTLAVDVRDLKLEGDELVLHYRITGDAHLDMVGVSVFVMDPQGGQGWMESFIPEVDREDIFRTAIPFDEAMTSDTGWAVDAFVTAADTKSGAQAHIQAHLPVERVDGKVVAAEGWSSMAES